MISVAVQVLCIDFNIFSPESPAPVNGLETLCASGWWACGGKDPVKKEIQMWPQSQIGWGHLFNDDWWLSQSCCACGLAAWRCFFFGFMVSSNFADSKEHVEFSRVLDVASIWKTRTKIDSQIPQHQFSTNYPYSLYISLVPLWSQTIRNISVRHPVSSLNWANQIWWYFTGINHTFIRFHLFWSYDILW